MTNNKQIIFDFKKVAFIELWWMVEGKGDITAHNKPSYPTVNGSRVEGVDRDTGRSMFEIAQDRKLFDRWIPVIEVHMLYGKRLMFKNDRAMEIWKKWASIQFKKED